MDVRSRRALGHLCRRKTGLKVISLTDGDISCSPLIIYHGNKLIANYKMAGAGIVKRAHMRSVSEPALRVSCGGYSRERTRLTDLAYERGKDNVAHWIGAWSFEEVGNLFCMGVQWSYNCVLFLSPGMCGSSVSCCKMPSQPTGVLVDCESTCLLLAKKRKVNSQLAGYQI